jgi:hypothetical protein
MVPTIFSGYLRFPQPFSTILYSILPTIFSGSLRLSTVYIQLSNCMTHRLLLVDNGCIDTVLDYCSSQKIAIVRGRSWAASDQILCWTLYCEDSAQLDFMLLKFHSGVQLARSATAGSWLD